MSKILILVMDRDYPFIKHANTNEPIKVQVQQTLLLTNSHKNQILAKANFLKNLKNKYLIKVESLHEEEDKIHINYEMVQNELKNTLSSASTILLSKIYAQLHEFSRYLSNIGVRILFNLQRIGITSNQMLKYFVGLDFSWEEDPDEEYLQQFYYKQVQEMLRPYTRNRISGQLLSNIDITQQVGLDNARQRKVSYTTLPTRNTRINKIDQKLRLLSTSPKFPVNRDFSRKKSNALTTAKNYNYNDYQMCSATDALTRHDKRKFSGDVKLESLSRFKLSQHESDIKSQYLRNKKPAAQKQNNCEQIVQSEVSTIKTKSKHEEKRQKQYNQMMNMNKIYVKDFVSVLQQADENNKNGCQEYNIQSNSSASKFGELRIRKTISTSFFAQSPRDDIYQIACQCMGHSMEVIQKFKSLVYDK